MAIREIRSCDMTLKNGETCHKDATNLNFALSSTAFEIDLCGDHTDSLFKTMDPYMSTGRKLKSGAPTKGKISKAPGSGPGNAEVRAWAKKNGIEVNSAGRIPSAIIEQYKAGITA